MLYSSEMARYITTIDLSDSQGSDDVTSLNFHINKGAKLRVAKRNHFNIDSEEEEDDEDDVYHTFSASQRNIIDEAMAMILSICSQCSREAVREAVCKYCVTRKEVKVVPLDDIVNNVVDTLINGSGTSSEPMDIVSSVKPAAIQSVPKPPPPPVALSPLQEVLCVFPDAKESFVETQLGEQGSVAAVIQHMAEHGYEKKQRPSTSNSKVESKDFKSKSWETSAKYREDALLCLYADYPYLHKAQIKREFAAASHHYYHTVCTFREALGMTPVVYPMSAEVHRRLSAIIRDKKKEWEGKGIKIMTYLPK